MIARQPFAGRPGGPLGDGVGVPQSGTMPKGMNRPGYAPTIVDVPVVVGLDMTRATSSSVSPGGAGR